MTSTHPTDAHVTVAIIGLGQAGSRFDEEPGRSCWSHAGAYAALPERARIIAGVDPDPEQRARFARRIPTATLCERVMDLVPLGPHIVVVATPPATHHRVLTEVLELLRPTALVVEKPLGMTRAERALVVDACQARGLPLLVHYNRRYSPLYRGMRALLADGAIGPLHSLSVRAPNRLWSIGSHALDLLCFLADSPPVQVRALARPKLAQHGEPAADALVLFESGVAGCLQTQGPKHSLIFETEAVGEGGRLRVDHNGARLVQQRLQPSERYAGYAELGPPKTLSTNGEVGESFVALAAEACDFALGHAGKPTCSGADAARSEALLDAIVNGEELCP